MYTEYLTKQSKFYYDVLDGRRNIHKPIKNMTIDYIPHLFN